MSVRFKRVANEARRRTPRGAVEAQRGRKGGASRRWNGAVAHVCKVRRTDGEKFGTIWREFRGEARIGAREPRGLSRCEGDDAASAPLRMRSARLAQDGGPRAGARLGGAVGSPRAWRNLRTSSGSRTSARMRMRPWQFGHAKASMPRVRSSSAQERYRQPARFGLLDSHSATSTAGGGAVEVENALARPRPRRTCADRSCDPDPAMVA